MKKFLPLCLLVPFVTHAENSNFQQEPNLSLELQTRYNNIKSSRHAETGTNDLFNWANTATLNVDSGYLNDVFGVDLGVYAINPVDAGDQFMFQPVVLAEKDSGGKLVPKGFAKLHHGYLKQKFKFNDFDIYTTQGLKVMKDFGAINFSEDFTNSAYEGYAGEAISKNIDFKLGYFTKYSGNKDEKAENLLTADGKKIDYIYTADMKYKFDNQFIRYYIGEGEDYLRTNILSYQYGFDNKHAIRIKGIYLEALDDYKSMTSNKKLFDSYAYLAELQYNMRGDNSFSTFSVAYTSAPREYGLGRFENKLSENSFGNNTYEAEGFTTDNETTIVAKHFHIFNPSFRLGVTARYGFNMSYEGNDFTQSELAVKGIYTPQSIEGLKIIVKTKPQNFVRQSLELVPYLNSDGHTMVSKDRSFIMSIAYTFQ